MALKLLKQTIKQTIRKFGYDIAEYPRLPLLVHHLRQFFIENDINVVLDVGAFLGLYCRMLRADVSYHGDIISFEPASKSFARLSAEMRGDAAWRGFNFGLSDTNKQVRLNTHGDHGNFNSVLVLKKYSADAYNVGHSSTAELVDLKTLDSVWETIFNERPNPRVFLKMDTQGHDTEVFLGSIAHHKHIVGLQSELPAIELYDGMRSMSETLTIYKEHGFTPVGFYPVNRPKAFKGAIPEFDTIFLRADI
jgi:FkbM family methyltransferase